MDDRDRVVAGEHDRHAVRRAHGELATGDRRDRGVGVNARVFARTGDDDDVGAVDLPEPRDVRIERSGIGVVAVPARGGDEVGRVTPRAGDVEVVVAVELSSSSDPNTSAAGPPVGSGPAVVRPRFGASVRSPPIEAGRDHRDADLVTHLVVDDEAPKMMLASGWATPWMTSAASFTSNKPRSLPPEMLSRMARPFDGRFE